jgi:hypothetical protein
MAKDEQRVWTPDPSTFVKSGGATPEVSPEERELHQQLVNEHSELRTAIIAILQTWASIDGLLCEVLADATGMRDPVIASHIFFASRSSHTQLKMIEGAISHLRRYHHPTSQLLPELEEINSHWKALRSSYHRLKEYRDAAAHRVIASGVLADGKQRVFLSLPFQDMSGMLKASENETMARFEASEIARATKEAGQLLADAGDFLKRLRRHLQALGLDRPE